MKYSDLLALSEEELEEMKKNVEQAILAVRRKKRDDAVAALRKEAKRMGFTLEELVAPPPKRRTTRAPKYANPDNPGETWSGMGRKPNWLTDNLAKGKTLEDMKI